MVEQSITQRLVPEQVRGQIFGVRGALNVAGYPLGGMLGGVLLSTFGVSFTFGTAVVLYLAMGVACLASPIKRGMRRSQEEP